MAIRDRFVYEILLCISYLISFVLNIGRSSSSCQWSSNNATYDLHPLTIASGGQSKYYTVRDSSSTTEEGTDANSNRNFTYAFNVCDKVLSYPSTTCEELAAGYCPSSCIDGAGSECGANGTCIEDITGKAYAYQMRTKDDGTEACHHLGSDNTGDYSFSLLDNGDPSAGVVLTYTNGDYCGTYGVNREFRIRLECENDAFNVPDSEYVYEINDACVYNMTITSIYGCPSECGIYSHSLCASQGLCSYDWTNLQAKCFCYHGYSGNDCSESSSDTVSADTKEAPEASKWVHTFKYTQTLTDSSNKNYNATVNVTYDLSSFDLSNEMFTVNDTDNSHFEYYFNVLDNIDTSLLPNTCKNATNGCDFDSNPNCTNLGVTNAVGAAFQYNTDSNVCNLVGTASSTSDYSWSLREDDDPAKGVVLTYTNGGYCSNINKNREFSITFECPDSTRDFYVPSEETDISEYVDETHDGSCEYSISIETALACPYECITDVYDEETGELISDQFSVCSGKGLCAADPSAGVVRCLCDSGWTGSDCNTEDVSSSRTIHDDHTKYQIAIAVISIIVVALIGGLFYSRMRYNTLQKNLQKQLLEDDDDEDEHNHIGKDMQLNAVKQDDSDDESGDEDAGIGDYPPNDTDGNELVKVTTTTGTTADDNNDLVVEDMNDNDDSDN